MEFGWQEGGWIEVICGSMFSGKTEELLRRVRRAQIAQQAVQIFKPTIDDRFHAEKVVSHDRRGIPAVVVENADDIERLTESATQVVAIDEAQFFDQRLVKVCQKLADRGVRVIVAGLDMDYRGEPFEPLPQLLAIAEFITKNHAICVCCGAPASRTVRLSENRARILVGEAEAYEARCRRCFNLPVEACPLPRRRAIAAG